MKWTVSKAAQEWGIARATLQKRLTGAGFDVKARATFTTRDITRAIVGDLASERIRETSARADLLELERREKENELVPMSEAMSVITEVLQPIKDALMAFPATMAARCNPADPKLARAELEPACREILQDASERATPRPT